MEEPYGTIRAILDGTVFRAPIMVKGISPVVRTWKEPITIARHAFGDVYRATEYRVPGPGKAELVFTGDDRRRTAHWQTVNKFDGPGVLQAQFNTDKSISSFARSCFQYAIDTKQDLWFATKDTISKQYDHTFKDIFQEIYDAEYKEKFEALGIEYFYTPHRRRRGAGHPLQGRVHLGLQELRRRRDERYGFDGVRLAGDDDLGTRFARRQL